MIDPRIYRAAFVPALFALVALMFSVEAVPGALHPPRAGIAASELDPRGAVAMARQIVAAAPERPPGSRGDALAADLVSERFAAIGAGKLSEQLYEGELDGDEVELRNVILTLPGTSERTIAVIAHRDSARGEGAASSAAATGVLVELAAAFGRTRHAKTLVFASTDGGSEGASGARELLTSQPAPELIDAVVAVAQPGAADPEPPHVLPFSAGPQSTAAQLVQTAKAALEAETERQAGLEGALGDLFRLALPSGLGEQAALISDGNDAIAVSGAGERPLDPEADTLDSLSARSMGEIGRTAFSLVAALDRSPQKPAHGPADHLTLAGNLIPGWAIALLALALLLPAALAALDGLARASRGGEPVAAALAWAAGRALPFAAALALAYLLVLLGIAPSPEFPFDPGRFGFGWRAAGVVCVLATALAIALLTLRPLAVPPGVGREALAPAIGAGATLAVAGIWLVNPYLALLLVPFAHLWILASRPAAPVPVPGVVVATALAAVPLAAGLAHLVEHLEVGAQAPWQLLLLLTSGQIPPLVALLGCLIAGSVAGVLAIARAGEPRPSPLSQALRASA